MKRRNLSGIYIFDTLEGDEKREPTCFEDCRRETQDAWLEKLDKGSLIELSKHLASTLRKVGDDFNIVACETE
jgi:hypothetical protein